MNIFLNLVTIAIEKIAEIGAGFLSMGIAYQPEIPEELLKK